MENQNPCDYIVLYCDESAGGAYTTTISLESSDRWVTHTFQMTYVECAPPTPVFDVAPILTCLRCGNDLLHKEIKAKILYCMPCKKLMEAAAHQEEVSEAIYNANKRIGL